MKVVKLTKRSLARTGLLAVPLALVLAGGSATAANYELVDLGANVSPADINRDGVIVGARNTDQYPSTAFRWMPATGFEDLDGTAAYAVNDAGAVTGSTLTGAFVLDGNNPRSWDEHTAYGIRHTGNLHRRTDRHPRWRTEKQSGD